MAFVASGLCLSQIPDKLPSLMEPYQLLSNLYGLLPQSQPGHNRGRLYSEMTTL